MKNDAGVPLASLAAPTRCVGPEQQPRGRSVAVPWPFRVRVRSDSSRLEPSNWVNVYSSPIGAGPGTKP